MSRPAIFGPFRYAFLSAAVALAPVSLGPQSLFPAALAGEYNDVLSVGDAAPEFENLPATDGKNYSSKDFKSKALVVVFTCNSCPTAQDYEDRLIALSKKYAGGEEVAVVAINVNKTPEDSFAKMKVRAEEKAFPFPYLYDETQEIATKFGAYATPEFYVLSPDRKIVYMGAMDDSSSVAKVEKKYVEPAIEAVLKGETPEKTETYAHGCKIRKERTRRR